MSTEQPQESLLLLAEPDTDTPRTRAEWKQAGFEVRQRAKPLRMVHVENALWYHGTWHAGEVGIYGRNQVNSIAELEARKAARSQEWEFVTVRGAFLKLTPRAKRLYLYLREKSEKGNPFLTSNAEMLAACKIDNNALRGIKDELTKNRLATFKFGKKKETRVKVRAAQTRCKEPIPITAARRLRA